MLVIAWCVFLPLSANPRAEAAEPGRQLPPAGTTVPPPSSRRQVSLVSGSDLARLQAAETIAAGDVSILADQTSPIDLDSAFRLAGVENPQIQIAATRVNEALAIRQLAAAQILPTLNGGSNYDNHTGNLQQSNGNILAVNRSALYVGAGANAIAAGTVNIPGIVWNTNVSVAAFNFLMSRQLVQEREFATLATRNQMMLDVAVAYLDLLKSEESRLIGIDIRSEAKEVARLTANYAATGQGRQADADRAATELRQRETDVLDYEQNVLTFGAKLAQLLNLDPSIRLHAADRFIVPRTIVPSELQVPQLIATAMMQRPELGERRAAIQRALLDLSGAKLLPFSPNMIVGFSAGSFGGGSNLVTPVYGNFGPRSDFDVVAYWSLQNLGIGNRALINGAAARYSVSNLELIKVLNQVRSEVASAYARTQARYAQIAINEKAVVSGADGFREDLNRIRAGGGLPIEVLNSLRLLARARIEYLASIIEYNQAEFELYVALGQPPFTAMYQVDAQPKPEPAPAQP